MTYSTAAGVVAWIRGRLRGLIVAAAIASVSVSAPVTWVSLDGLHDDYAGLSALERERKARSVVELDQDAWRFIRARVQADDRYAIITPPGATASTFRAYAAYSLLPAVQVETRQEADVVFLIGVPTDRATACADTRRRLCVRRPTP